MAWVQRVALAKKENLPKSLTEEKTIANHGKCAAIIWEPNELVCLRLEKKVRKRDYFEKDGKKAY